MLGRGTKRKPFPELDKEAKFFSHAKAAKEVADLRKLAKEANEEAAKLRAEGKNEQSKAALDKAQEHLDAIEVVSKRYLEEAKARYEVRLKSLTR